MSPLMIILLILILTISSSHPSDIKKYTTERYNNFHVKDYQNPSLFNRFNYTRINVTKNDQDFTTLKSKKLRHDFQNLLRTMVKKIILQRRSKEVKFFENPRNKGHNYIEKMANENKISIGDLPVENHLEQVGRDGEDYNNVIGRNSDGIRQAISRDLLEVSETLTPLVVRRISSSRIRKVRGNSARPKMIINSANGNETRTNSRKKRETVEDAWIRKVGFKNEDTRLKMHALIVKDEDIPPCCSPAKEVTNRRYFMCSGAVLTTKHALSTASCMHFADVYEHHIDADLAILIGATHERSYVIKINRYDMHPEYNYNVESKNHASNNLAILYLACSIKIQDVIIPKLPKGINDDVGHMCCREGCDVVTIVQDFGNRHTAQVIKARNLPAPRHFDDESVDEEVSNFRQSLNPKFDMHRLTNMGRMRNESFPLSRRIGRSPLRLAAAPIFFVKESRASSNDRSSGRLTGKNRRKLITVGTSRMKMRNHQGVEEKKESLNLDDLVAEKFKRGQIPILRALEEEGVNVEEQLAAVDWEQIEETMAKKFSDENRATMEIFAKNVAEETMKRLEIVLGDDGDLSNNSQIFQKLMPGDKKNKTIESFVKVFTKVVTSLVPPNGGGSHATAPDDGTLEEKDLEDPSPLYQECPPLGSPIIVDGILVGLVAYTCDDVQSWVEWQYVSVAKNMDWIRKKMFRNYEPPEKCGVQVRKCALQKHASPSVMEGDKLFFNDKIPWNKNVTSFNEDEVEWSGGDDSPRNFDDSRIAETKTSHKILKDSWFAGNSELAPQPSPNEGIMTSNSPNKAISSIPQHVPVYSVNTCYVRADGSSDCQTGSEFGGAG